MKIFVILLSIGSLVTSIPIMSDDETKLNSIVISEINLSTEATVVDQEIAVEPASSFLDLVEKYEGMYGNEKADDIVMKKRDSFDSNKADQRATKEEKLDVDNGRKSLIDKVEIPDPEVKKEFENELALNQISLNKDETTENLLVPTDYEPNYEKKIVIHQADENIKETNHNQSTPLTIHDKENLQAHLVEQLVHHNEHKHEFTTIIPEQLFTNRTLLKNPDVIEILEHIVYESEQELKMHEHSTTNPINVVQIDVDPIEIIPKDRHREAKADENPDDNDKFAGFSGIPQEDLIQPGEETTEPDNFFKKTDVPEENGDEVVDPIEAVRETLEYVAIYGKSLNLNYDFSTTTEVEQIATTLEPIYESKTEISVVNTKVTVNTNKEAIQRELKKSSSSEESSQQSLSNKSSEESKEVKTLKEEKKKNEENESASSEEIQSENVGKEDLSDDKLNLRNLEFSIIQKPNSLPDDIFKESTVHEIKKKDHPAGLVVPFDMSETQIKNEISDTKKVTYEIEQRQLNDETPKSEEVPTSTIETMTKVYEAFEEVITAVSEGMQLTKELRHHVESFRNNFEENKIIMDTHSEPFSAKNSKNPLVDVNDLDMMKLKERSFHEEPKLSFAVIPLVAVVSLGVLVILYKFIRGKTASIRLD